MKEEMLLCGVTLARRYTRRQKAYFVEAVNDIWPSLGFPARILHHSPPFAAVRNLEAGEPQAGGLCIAAAYDTPPRTLLPNLRYFPFHTAKNLREEKKELALRLLIILLPAGGAWLCLPLFSSAFPGPLMAAALLALILAPAAAALRPRANRVNFNRSSASLALMACIAKQLAGAKAVSFLFFDQQTASFKGIKAWRQTRPDEDRLLLMLDCLAQGETVVVAHRPAMAEAAEALIRLGESHGLPIRDKEYPDEKADNNILAFHPSMLYLVSGQVEKHEFVVKHTCSKRDCKVDMERLEKLCAALADFAAQQSAKASANLPVRESRTADNG